MNKVRAIQIRIGEQPKIVEMENNLAEYQDFVDGLIEVPFLSKKLCQMDIDVIINEEGMVRGMMPGMVIVDEEGQQLCLAGNVIIVGHQGEDFTSLTDEQIKFIVDKMEYGRYMYTKKNEDQTEEKILVTSISLD